VSAAVVSITAAEAQPDIRILRLKGRVEIKTSTMLIQADEAEYHGDTGEIEARGNVHIKPIPQ